MPGADTAAVTPVIRRVQAADWQALRALRLEMLQDTPKAYLERYDDAARLDNAQWRARVKRWLGEGTAVFAAIIDGAWVGTAAAYELLPGQVHLVSVFVTARHRGTGVMDTLLAATQDWARAVGAHTMRLLVHEDNARARAYYRKAGFVETGTTVPYDLDVAETEIEMAAALPPDALRQPGDSLR